MLCSHVVDRFRGAQTVAPEANPLIAGRLRKIDPRFPVVRAVRHTFVSGTEPLGALTHYGTAHRVVAAVVDAQHRAPLLQERVAILLKHARTIEVATNAVVQEHHIHPKLRRMPQRGLAPGTVKAYPVTSCDLDQVDHHGCVLSRGCERGPNGSGWNGASRVAM